jgi:hypothetical protein
MQPTPEQIAAAKRVRRVNAGEKPTVVYADMMTLSNLGDEEIMARMYLDDDRETLADLALQHLDARENDMNKKQPKAGEVRWATYNGFCSLTPPERMLLLIAKGEHFGTIIGKNIHTGHLHDLDDFHEFSLPFNDPLPTNPRSRDE